MKIFLLTSLCLLLACTEKPAEQPKPAQVPSDTSKVFYAGSSRLKMQGRLVNGQKEGEWRSWYEDGTPWSLTTFEKGLRNGKTVTWYENGQVRYEGSYRNDGRSGHWVFYDENGVKVSEVTYEE